MFEFGGDDMHVQAVVNQHVICSLHPNARCSLRVMSRYFAGAMRRDSRPTSSAYFVHRQSRFVAVAERDSHIATPRTAPSDLLAGRATIAIFFPPAHDAFYLAGRGGYFLFHFPRTEKTASMLFCFANTTAHRQQGGLKTDAQYIFGTGSGRHAGGVRVMDISAGPL